MVIEIGDNFDQAFQMLRALTAGNGPVPGQFPQSVSPRGTEDHRDGNFGAARLGACPITSWFPAATSATSPPSAKVLAELQEVGLIEKLPQLVVVQAQGANPFYEMLATGASESCPCACRTPKRRLFVSAIQ